MLHLRIDPEFRDKVPPLTAAELQTLEENILNDGRVLVPLVVWNGTIIDGHNRYAIVQRHPEIPFDVVERDFSDRYAAIVWICRNQLGRRNLTDEQKSYLIGKQYEAQKMTVGAPAENKNAKNNSTKMVELTSRNYGTAAEIAKEHGVGKSSVERAEKFAKGVDAAEAISPGAKDKVLSGAANVPKSVIAAIPAMEEGERLDVVEAIMTGEYKRPAHRESPNPAGFSREMRKNRAEIEEIVADMHNPSTVPEFTIDFLIDDIRANSEIYVQMLRNTLTDRSTLLTDENRPRIANAIEEYVIKEIRKIKELVEK